MSIFNNVSAAVGQGEKQQRGLSSLADERG